MILTLIFNLSVNLKVNQLISVSLIPYFISNIFAFLLYFYGIFMEWNVFRYFIIRFYRPASLAVPLLL